MSWDEPLSPMRTHKQLELSLKLPGLCATKKSECNVLGLRAKEAKKVVQQKKNEMTLELMNEHHHYFAQAWDNVKDLPSARQKRKLQQTP